MVDKTQYKKGVMGFDQMAVGLGVLAIVVAMVLVVLTQVMAIGTIAGVPVNASNLSEGYTTAPNTFANTSLNSAITAIALYGNFFSILVILGIFVGIIGLLYMVTRGTGQDGA